MLFPTLKHELGFLKQGYTLVAGCDEAGRGPLAGPVVAAACILDPKNIGRRTKNKWYARIRDSKTIPEEEREILYAKILKHAVCHGVGIVWQEEIDRLNIHHASLRAMRLAAENLANNIRKIKIGKNTEKLHLLVDGRFIIPNLEIKGFEMAQTTIVHGDALSLSISAASIIAKVERDAIMRRLDGEFPGYGLGRHKGYGTKEHFVAIRKLGVANVHRKSFLKI
jgi:ribonuclease HII